MEPERIYLVGLNPYIFPLASLQSTFESTIQYLSEMAEREKDYATMPCTTLQKCIALGHRSVGPAPTGDGAVRM